MSKVVAMPSPDRFERNSLQETHLIFSNSGTLEIELVKLLGVSVKETADPIGFFGTGLKYAMATVLRLGGRLTITTGGQTYVVGGKSIRLRDKGFTQLTLNSEELGFTTELGKQWEPWMVVRELYSNAMDEGGTIAESTGIDAEARDDCTTIALFGQPFLDVWKERSRYFVATDVESPMIRSAYADAYAGMGKTVFYRGIRIHQTEFPVLYRYNLIEDVTLTEDRTLKYAFVFDDILEKMIITSRDREFIQRTLTSGNLFHEGRLDFDGHYYGLEMSDEVKAVWGNLLERLPENANKNALRYYEKQTNTQHPMMPATLTRVQQLQLDRAISFMNKLGCDYLHLYPVKVVRWLGENTHGLAKHGMIYLSVECFDRGTKYVASTLYEEYVHCQYGLSDLSRGLQTFCFDKIITLAEELQGEPL